MGEKPFAAFDTESPENTERREGNTAEKIADKLGEKQMNQLLPVLKAVEFGIKGPLQEDEIGCAKDYARELALKLEMKKD